MHISREKLQQLERSLNECARHAVVYGKTLPSDSRDRRDLDANIARCNEMLADIREMLAR